MSHEMDRFDGFRVSKENRRNNLDAQRSIEPHHPFKRIQHDPDPAAQQRRAHLHERSAMKR